VIVAQQQFTARFLIREQLASSWAQRFRFVLIPKTSQIIALAIVLLAFFSTAHAERLPIKTYTTADGLAHNEVNKIVRDSRGFLWFCTANGLSRFDGYTFTNYSTEQGLPHPYVNDLLETRSGEFWVATNGGLVLFNPKGVPGNPNYSPQTGPMFAAVMPDDTDRLAKATIVILQDHNGTVWCGTLKGLFRLAQAAGFTRLEPVPVGLPTDYAEQSYINALLEDNYGTLWIGTAHGLYRRWPNGETARYGKSDQLPDDTIYSLLKNKDGSLWVGTPRGGMFRMSITGDRHPPVITRTYTNKNGLGSDWIFTLYSSTDGKLWAGGNQGLYEFSSADGTAAGPTHFYTEQNGLSFDEVVAITEDRDGNLWLATNTAGAMKLARNGFTTFDKGDGIKAIYWLFESPSNELFAHGAVLGDQRNSIFEGAKLDILNLGPVEAHRRVGRFDGKRFDWTVPNVLRHRYLGWSDKPTALQSRTGEWWIGTGHGLYLFPKVKDLTELKSARPLAIYINKELPVTMVYCLYEDIHGDLWMAATHPEGNTLVRWERATRTFHDLAHTEGLPSLKEKLPTAFQEDGAGNLWIGFNQGELVRFQGGRFTVFSSVDGVPAGRINDLYLDHGGNLWIASGLGGVSRTGDPNATHPTFVNYSTKQGLSTNNGSSVIEDLYGLIYIGTGQGLDRLDPTSGRIKHYTTADGLAAGLVLSAFRAHDGELWFGTSQGLSRLTPEPPQIGSVPPPIMLTGVRIADTAQLIPANGETDLRLPDLDAGGNQLQIDFVGLSFAFGESLRYQYQLEGADKDWGTPTAQRTVNYANLAPGHYRFMVRAVTAEGNFSETPAFLTFTVQPHLWQRWWFLLLSGLLLSLIVYSYYRSRMARLLGIERIRTRIAADLHDDIGANLTRIAILSEVAHSQMNETNPSVANPLASIARISRESVASMSDIVWAINPRRDSLLDLVVRMRRFANEVFTGRKIEFTFNAPQSDRDQKLGADLRRDVFLIFKEVLTNVVRHSNCTRVQIELVLDRSWLELKIEDDGCGFEPSVASEGHGLISIKRRAEALGGNLELNSAPNAGTKLWLKVPRR